MVVLGWCYSLSTLPVSLASERAFSFGIVPQYDARLIQDIWQPVLDLVSQKTGLQLIPNYSRSIPEFEKQFSAGQFDFVYLNPYHLIVAQAEQGYIPLVRDEGQRLSGIVVVRRDSPIHSVNELDGRTVAFPAPNALGAALIPRAEFDRKFRITIIPKYVRSHTSVYLNVFLKQAAAGGGIQSTFDQQPVEIRSALRVLYQTQSIASHPIAVHPRIPASVRGIVLKTFLELGTEPIGRGRLEKIPIFAITTAHAEDYEELKSMGLEDYYLR